MWKFLEQRSFPLNETEYMQQLDAVAEYLNDWGVTDTVRVDSPGNRATVFVISAHRKFCPYSHLYSSITLAHANSMAL